MQELLITNNDIENFINYLKEEERSTNTIDKYQRDIRKFYAYNNNEPINKEKVINYKNYLINNQYKPRSINSMLVALNTFFKFINATHLKVKTLKLQKEIFYKENQVLTKNEYKYLCKKAKKTNIRLSLIIQTICSTGIRVSELPFITVEAVKKGQATVSLKGKTRTIIITKELQTQLLKYIKKLKIKEGQVFITKSGKPINRTTIWKEMKKLTNKTDIEPNKVFPHNLRHLFARMYYKLNKDIGRLADILGHSNIETTRIYIITTVAEHRKDIENLHLVI